jgi:CRISPR-associated endoribonuclease Cas6
MPVSFSVLLKPGTPVKTSDLTPDRVHGLFFSLLGEKLAEELHNSGSFKPFTVSYPPFFREERETDRIYLSITFLRDDLFPRFLSEFMMNENTHLALGEVSLSKHKRPLVREEGLASYESILEEATDSRTIVLDFITPTAFKKGRFDQPLPSPELVFKSLLKKWNFFSGIRIETPMSKYFRESIHISGLWIRTKKVELSRLGKFTGFTGRVVYYLDVPHEEPRRIVNALARFAEFAGIGRKTTMGFGKVTYVKQVSGEEPEVPEDTSLNTGPSEDKA